MRIAKSHLIDPERNGLYAVTAIALSYFVFAYSARFGQISILAYYGVWLPLIAVNYRRVLGNYGLYLPIFAFSILTILSIFWSAAPPVTVRASLQYFSHIVCALIAMRVVGIRSFLRGSMIGTGIVLVYSLLFGSYFLDPLDGSFSFVGAFSSKNQLGFYASLGVYFSFAAIIILKERSIWMLPPAGLALLSAYCLFASESATSVITVMAVVGASLVLRAVILLSPRHRIVLVVAGVVLGGLGAAAFVYAGGVDLILGAFGKDSTLTGRTYLWQQGIAAALANPIFGVGYQAYWVQGFSEAERLWDEFYIPTRAGFHFHNTFIETAVETGIIGLVLLVAMLVVALIGNLKRLLVNARDPEAGVLFGLAMLLVERAFVEIDIIFAYQIGSFLLYFMLGKLAQRRALPATRSSVVRYYGDGASSARNL
ncbi:O-antigen ligase family protein [Agrobacterium vitis]|uniref:O-antigen ligase family protein n=1 Tax=Agrobacterium vitis TaxID=373 RepID=UPI0015DA19F0|nr:O-antigen ligase [Agrobacterium vitis]MCF1455189.1 O-antigen ligase family protein [Agrobacterium vitis]BCH52394.1 exopolysaccharide production protein ExoQ [Agrobacterium vitis]